MKIISIWGYLSFIFLVSCVGDTIENVERRQEILDALPTFPVISSISPSESPEEGGGTLTIAGARLNDAVVSVGGSDCSILTQTASSVTCTIPSGSAGDTTVEILNNRGEKDTEDFVYRAAPAITSLSLSAGTTAGGDEITITGTNFYEISDITFGDESCTDIVTVSETSATCTTAASSAGAVDIEVTNGDNQTGSKSGLFTYETPPSISSFSPTTIYEAGSQTLTITGTGFVTTPEDPEVTVDGEICSVTSADSTTIVCTTPAGSGSGVEVVVANPSGVDTADEIDYIAAPTITSIDIENVALGGGDTVTITGTGFVSGGSFGIVAAGVACASTTFNSATEIECETGSTGSGTSGNIVVTNNDGQTATSTQTFTYRVAPGLTSITPNAGSIGGSTDVTVVGTGFDTDGNITVSIGGNNCTDISVSSATSLTCKTPAGSAGAVDVIVTNTEDNQASNTLTDGYTYNVSPTISSLSPRNFGPVAGTNTISFIGTNFSAGAVARIDGTNCTTSTVVNASQIDCEVPAHAAGLVNVAVTNSDGQSYTLASGYTYTAEPTVTDVDPPAGPTAGNQTVTITGTNFFEGITFSINGTPCTTSTYVSATSGTCVTYDNSGTGGPFAVLAANTDGQSGSMANAYEFIDPPTVSGVTPSFGPVAGGTTITVTGTDFYDADTVTVTINDVACNNVQNLTDTSFDCETGDNTAAGGPYTVKVVNDVDGQSGSGGAFNYVVAPTITKIEADGGGTEIDGGPNTGNNTIRIVGTGFQAGMAATVGTATCTVTDIDENNIDCDIPPSAYTNETVDVKVTNTDDQSFTLEDSYTFRDPPVISSYDYAFGPVGGGNTITITGMYFYDGDNFQIEIDGNPCDTSTYVNDTTATCEVPTGSLGAVDVTLTQQDLQTATDTGAYTYVVAPSISSFNPTTIYEEGSQSLVITGSDFEDGATVTIDGEECSSPTVDSATQITCTTPAGEGTGVTVEVTNLDGQTGISTIDYIPAPTITSYDYAFGPVGGGNTITITGENFVAGGSFDIEIGGTSCGPAAFVSDTSATCVVPMGALGAVDVVLTNNDGQEVTDEDAFEYVAAPSITSFNPTNIYEAGNQSLVITGSGFQSGATVTIDGGNCDPLVVDSATQITCTTPAGSGPGVTVEVENLDGQTDTSTIDYIPAPTISSFNPTTIYEEGSQSLVITGTGFLAGATVTIDGEECGSLTVDLATQITCTTPAGEGAGVTVEVENTDGQTGTSTIDYIPAPTITSYDYAYGPVAGGNTITITGENFVAGGSFDIEIGGTSCGPAAFVSDTSATCMVPMGVLGTVDVVLTNNDGQEVTDEDAFEFIADPVISSLNLSSLYADGSQSLVVTGNYFKDGTDLTIDEDDCTSLSVDSDTQISCQTPAGSGTGVTVLLTRPDGQTASTTIDYIAAPTISSFSPTTIYEAGSQTLTINGSGFEAGSLVTIDGNACSPVTFTDATDISCSTPAGIGSGVEVKVTNTDGQVVTSTIDYKPKPSITSATTSAGAFGASAGGGATVTIIGSGFFDDIGAPTITIGTASCSSPNVVSSTEITCSLEANAAGLVDVTVTNADTQTDTLTDGFEYTNAPAFGSVSPASGGVAGGTSIVITGANFIDATEVEIGGTSCVTLTLDSSSQLTCVTPSGTSGAVDIEITNPAQITEVETDGFTYLDNAPSITAISPQGGAIGGVTSVTITGTDFDPTLADGDVKIGGNNCTGVTATATEITCTTPDNGSAGFEDVVVTNPDMQSDTLFTGYLYAQGPTLTSISPSAGTTAGGTTITLTGTDFAATATVTVGGETCATTFVDDTTLTCVTPEGSAGAADVVVTQYFQSSTASTFTYSAGADLEWQVGSGPPNPPNPADYEDPEADIGFIFTLKNVGSSASSSITLDLTGTNATVWTLLSDNCTGTTLAPGEECTVNVYFQWSLLPDSATTYTATLEATATDGGTTTNDLQGQNL